MIEVETGVAVNMFSVHVDLTCEPPEWHAVCDVCGQELDVDESPMTIFRMTGPNADTAGFAERLAKLDRSIHRAIVVDSGVEVIESHRGVGTRLLAHARKCGAGRHSQQP